MARGIKVVDWLIPNNEELKLVDTDYVQHTYNGTDKTQTEINSELQTLSGYYECSTEGSTAAKVVAATNYNLTVGGSLKIKFLHANTITPTSPATITLSINNQTAKTILYAGEAVTASNTWDDDEIVNVFYDGTNYLAYSVEGGGLLNSMDVTDPSTKKGLTESVIVSVVGDVKKESGQYVSLQDQIYAITASSATVSLTQRPGVGYDINSIREINTTNTTDVIPLYSDCTTLARSLTLYDRANNTGSWTQSTVATGKSNPVTNTSNSDDNFYMTVDRSQLKTYNFYVKGNIYGIDKNSSGLNVYYVYGPFYYHLFARENAQGIDPSLDATEILTLQSSPYSSLTITPRGYTINLNISDIEEGYFNYLYFMIPTAPNGGASTINYLILTSGSYTSTLAMDVVSEGSTTQWSQTEGAPTGYTIYRTVPINTTGSVNLSTY